MYLELGVDFDQPIAAVSWPSSLTTLNLMGEFNHAIGAAVWPESLTKIKLFSFDRPWDTAAWPAHHTGELACFFESTELWGKFQPSHRRGIMTCVTGRGEIRF